MTKILTAFTLSECMETMAEYVKANEELHEKNIIFCEDRLTMVAERTLLKATGGSFFSSVVTFSRFLKTDARVITRQGSVMAIGDIALRLQKENKLKLFRTPDAVKNGAENIYDTVAQFSASCVDEEMIEESASLLDNSTLKDKLSDFALIYREYKKFLLENGYLDENKYLSLLPNCIRNSEEVKGANVFFLCYNSFTKQATDVIRAVEETAKNVYGIFCAGKEEFYTNVVSLRKRRKNTAKFPY